MLPKSPPPVGYGSGEGERRFSGDKEPVGSRVLAAAARILSAPSSALSYSGEESLELLDRFPSTFSLLLQKPLLRTPFFDRRHAGGL
jgi:hypothetical protein